MGGRLQRKSDPGMIIPLQIPANDGFPWYQSGAEFCPSTEGHKLCGVTLPAPHGSSGVRLWFDPREGHQVMIFVGVPLVWVKGSQTETYFDMPKRAPKSDSLSEISFELPFEVH